MSVVFHHGGEFVRDYILYYTGGQEHVVNGIDRDRWCYFEATGILKELGYDDHLKYRLWWYVIEDDKYKRIVDDNDTDVVGDYVVENKRVTHLYVEHSAIGMVGSHLGQSFMDVGQSSMDLDMSGGVGGQEGHVVEEGTMNEGDGVCDDEEMSGDVLMTIWEVVKMKLLE